MDELRRFHQEILAQAHWQPISLDRLIADDILDTLFAKAHPSSILRNQAQATPNNQYLFNFLAMQSPVICYPFRRHYRYLAGAFTVEKWTQAIAEQQLDPDTQMPMFVFKKKPSEAIRRQIIQFDLTNNLMDKCFVNDTKKLSFLLRAWFKKDQGARSIFQSQEWLLLYPHLNTSAKTAAYLSISKKDF
ncbi:hypothetical protein HGP28_15240 [Vibrio sp. SM6]|uniref:Uncharacterized protein n=1 Tax=Vibrio agarilyticus TaxID=2726741 RepID=A0A7X8TSZ3_9VIBR|nr:hypothetical protein [Vibrio agarilyticus]NLS14238.1 hypothetical protein [Vibrio agarilyticus]